MQAVTTADIVRPIFLVRMIFDSSPLNIWSGVGDLSYSSVTYTGVGELLSISEIQETAELKASGINVSITGLKPSFIYTAKHTDYQGRLLEVMLGAFDSSGDLIVDPVVIFSGFMDTMIIYESGETSTISVSVENKLIAFERAKVRRYTAEDQKIDYPTDKGFEFVAATSQKEIVWGRPSPQSGGGGATPQDNVNRHHH
tara:strand:- start:5151 stop:5747 length:597 start_codon:yes stop_codon:yes gene_type:complete